MWFPLFVQWPHLCFSLKQIIWSYPFVLFAVTLVKDAFELCHYVESKSGEYLNIYDFLII